MWEPIPSSHRSWERFELTRAPSTLICRGLFSSRTHCMATTSSCLEKSLVEVGREPGLMASVSCPTRQRRRVRPHYSLLRRWLERLLTTSPQDRRVLCIENFAREVDVDSFTPLDRASTVPLYVQIKERVRIMLADQVRPGDKVFTEQELSKLFGVSRMTVRQAIQELVDEGLIHRVRGAGTFLSSPKVTDSLQRWWNHFEDWALQGKKVSMEILDFKRVESDADTARRLMIAERTEVLYITRLWHVDGTPIGLGYFYLRPSVGDILSQEDVEHQHMYMAVSKRLGVPIVGEQVEIEAAGASHVTAARLKIGVGDAVLVRRVTQYYGKGEPIVTATLFYRGDLYRYSVYIPAQPTTSGAGPSPVISDPLVEKAVAGVALHGPEGDA